MISTLHQTKLSINLSRLVTEKWSFSDQSLVCHNNFTETGYNVYWEALDAAFKFNSEKHELFLAKAMVSASKDSVNNEICKEDSF